MSVQFNGAVFKRIEVYCWSSKSGCLSAMTLVYVKLCLSSGFTSCPTTSHDLTRDLTEGLASAELFMAWFPPLLSGADGSPHRTPVGFPPGKQGDLIGQVMLAFTQKCNIQEMFQI